MIDWRHLSRLVTARETGELRKTVIGIGEAGCKVVDHMIGTCVTGFEYVSANTDPEVLIQSLATKTIQLDPNELGTRGQPELGRQGTTKSEDIIRRELAGTDLLFVTLHLGGGTGTYAAPEIVRIAKEMGIVTVGVVSSPYATEGDRAMSMASACLNAFQATVDSLTVVPQQELLVDQLDASGQAKSVERTVDLLANSIIDTADDINKNCHQYMVSKRAVISWWLKRRL
ncbi:MAG: hypothetical protein IPG23_13100 [Burkholderiales bacterium]|nr:hypothetical protein [Burkholderiales bacterium]